MAQSQATSARDAVRDVVPDLIGYTEKWLFGEVWERPQLKKRDRSLIVVATLIALGRERQLAGHLNRALDNGVTKEEIISLVTGAQKKTAMVWIVRSGLRDLDYAQNRWDGCFGG